MFEQVYSIHSFYVDLPVPCVFALLPGKSTNTYVEMFAMLLDVFSARSFRRFKVETLVSDFESGLISAMKKVPGFDKIEHRGCSFHYMRAVIQNVRSAGLADLYMEKGSFYDSVRMLLALGLVPADRKQEYFDSICAAKAADGDFLGFALQYFQKAWFQGHDVKVSNLELNDFHRS